MVCMVEICQRHRNRPIHLQCGLQRAERCEQWFDAPNTRTAALLITPGTYFGFVDMNDSYDLYKFQVSAGQGIHVKVKNERYCVSF